MKVLLIVISVVSLLIWGGARNVANIQFNRNCEGHMKWAADANTIELALQKMEIVISYLEHKGLTRGYTSIIYRTPNEDVGFWYNNLKASFEELKKINPASATQLEKSNLLMKLGRPS